MKAIVRWAIFVAIIFIGAELGCLVNAEYKYILGFVIGTVTQSYLYLTDSSL